MKTAASKGSFLGRRVSEGTVVIGGTCKTPGAISPNNGLPLTQHAAVKLGPNHFAMPNWELRELHFLYSWKCCISEGDFTYRYASGRIEIIEYSAGVGDFDGFPYGDYPVIFSPAHFLLRPIPDEEQELIFRLNDTEADHNLKFDNEKAKLLSIPTHQFGGMPFLLNPLMNQKQCAACGSEMELIASIGNTCFSRDEGFFGNDFVQLVYFGCADCHALSAVNIAG